MFCEVIIEVLFMVNIYVDKVIGGKEVVMRVCEVVISNYFYDVFILDWNMFDIGGLEVVVIINQEFLNKQLKVIMFYVFELLYMCE